ncbi:MAG: hypothetical protein ACI9EF_002599 [Pseudohongiellaceae bacterium]|jgi:hypothetical protein
MAFLAFLARDHFSNPDSRLSTMITKDDILESILFECDIVLHLAKQIPEGGLDYRQTPDQRSNLEVLRYLSFCGVAGALAMINSGWDEYKRWAEESENLGADDIPAAMDRQKVALRETFAALTEDDLDRETTHPLGHKLTLGRGLFEVPLKWMAAYRMQLFLGVKGAGNTDVWTPDCWGGVSMSRDDQRAE